MDFAAILIDMAALIYRQQRSPNCLAVGLIDQEGSWFNNCDRDTK